MAQKLERLGVSGEEPSSNLARVSNPAKRSNRGQHFADSIQTLFGGGAILLPLVQTSSRNAECQGNLCSSQPGEVLDHADRSPWIEFVMEGRPRDQIGGPGQVLVPDMPLKFLYGA